MVGARNLTYPIPIPCSESILGPIPEPIPELVLEPIPKLVPEPIPELNPNPIPELVPESIPEIRSVGSDVSPGISMCVSRVARRLRSAGIYGKINALSG